MQTWEAVRLLCSTQASFRCVNCRQLLDNIKVDTSETYAPRLLNQVRHTAVCSETADLLIYIMNLFKLLKGTGTTQCRFSLLRFSQWGWMQEKSCGLHYKKLRKPRGSLGRTTRLSKQIGRMKVLPFLCLWITDIICCCLMGGKRYIAQSSDLATHKRIWCFTLLVAAYSEVSFPILSLPVKVHSGFFL